MGGTNRWVIACGFLAANLLTGSASLAGIEIVASSGDASPDGNGQLSNLIAPSINEAGQLAFVAELAGTAGGTADNLAMFRRDSNGLTLIARRGGTFSGQPINTFFPTSTAIDADGTVSGTVVLGPPNSFLSFFGDGGSMTPMVVPGSSSPSGNNMLLGVNHAAVNDTGFAVYQAAYFGDNPEVGLYERAPNGAVTTRVLRNIAAPRGGTINGFGPRFVINESNQIGAVLGIDTGSGIIQSASRIDGTTIHELARDGDLALDGITTITKITSSRSSSNLTPIPMINDSGQVAFPAQYVQPASRLGVFIADDAGASLVAPGNSLPGGSTLEDVTLLGLSNSGQVGFWAEFFGGTDRVSGLYVADSSGPQLVALEDTPTPTPGKFFRSFFTGSSTQNANGQIAFLAELSDTANGAAAGRGLYFYDPEDGLQQIIRSGDALNGGTVVSLFFWGTVHNQTFQCPDTSLTGLNSVGQVAFAYQLDNGENGIAIWTDAGLPGDYNNDGTVDAADYTVWRNNLGSPIALPNDDTAGVGPDDYDRWKQHYGSTLGAAGIATGLPSQVPEPSGLLLVMLALPVAILFWRRGDALKTRRGFASAP
jgi:hypothetical protein